jgi:endonuclease/exonuclease/phosphatase (EEP) superfamily protein YafD
LDVYRIYPYTFIHGVEAKENTLTSGTQKISILEANVLQSNGDHEVLKKFIREKSPDIFFLTEVNDDWARSLREFDSTYPHHLLHPQDNTYGLAFYSRLPWHHAKVNFLIEAEIPSVEAEIILPSGDSVQVYGLHPRPPRPQNKFTTERDAELIKVARSAKATERAVLLVGDLNDVAWSHTTRLFRRVSRMLDIRIGRGFFPTFPVGYGVFRFPIDHVFISDHFRVADVQVLSDIGSDHYPLWVTLSYEPGLTEFQEAPKADQENRKEAQEILEKVK